MKPLLELLNKIPTLSLSADPAINARLIEQLGGNNLVAQDQIRLMYKPEIDAHEKKIHEFLVKNADAINNALYESISTRGYLGKLIQRHTDGEIEPGLVIMTIAKILQKFHLDDTDNLADKLSTYNIYLMDNHVNLYDLLNLKTALIDTIENKKIASDDAELNNQALLIAVHYNQEAEKLRIKDVCEVSQVINKIQSTINELLEDYTKKTYQDIHKNITNSFSPFNSEKFISHLIHCDDPSPQFEKFMRDEKVKALIEKYKVSLHMHTIIDLTKNKDDIIPNLSHFYRHNENVLLSSSDSSLKKLLHRLAKLLHCTKLQSNEQNKLDQLKKSIASSAFFKHAKNLAQPPMKENIRKKTKKT